MGSVPVVIINGSLQGGHRNLCEVEWTAYNSGVVWTNETRPSDERRINPTFMLALGCMGAISMVLHGTPTNAMLYTFYKFRRLITPFTVNIIALLVLDMWGGLFACLLVVRTIDNEWLRTPRNCHAALFVIWTYSSLINLLSANLCVDRWLAILRPVWYRRDRTIRDSLIVLGFIYLYHTLLFTPLFILTVLEPLPEGEYCDQPVSSVYTVLLLTAIAIIPQGFLYLTYPVLFYLVWKRRHRRLLVVRFGPSSEGSSGQGGVHPRVAPLASNLRVTANPTNGGRVSVTTSRAVDERARRRRKEKLEMSAQHNLVILSVAIQCIIFIPVDIVVTMRALSVEYSLFLMDIHNMIFIIGLILTPINSLVFLAFMSDVRKELLRILRDHFRSDIARRR